MESNRSGSIVTLAALLAALRIVAGCGSAGGGQVVQQAISVTIAPTGAQSVDPGQTKQFSANVSNDSSSKGVSWTLTQSGAACSPGCGSISPASTGSGQPTTYTAPAAVNANVQFDVTATAVADGTKSATDVTTAVPAPMLNNPAQLPAATVGQSYSYTLTEAGGVAPVAWSITSGSLPAGLSLSGSTGVISGMPTVASQAVSAAQRHGGELQPDVTASGFTVQGCDSGNPPLCNAQPVSLLVNSAAPPPDFALSALPNSLTIVQGSSGMSAITITPSSGFSGTVNLTASGLSAGVTHLFSAIANNSSTLTLTASGSAALGTVNVTITGMSGSLTHTTSISLTVNAAKALPACSSGNNPITAQPAFVPASVTLSGSPQTATVSVTAPSAVNYQWFVGAQPFTTGSSPIAGATSASYTTPTLTAAFSGLFYTVQVNTATCSQLSNSAFLTVNENPSGNGPIQIPTVQQQKRFALTQSGGTEFLACGGTANDGPPPSCSQGAPAIDWTIYLNGSPCQSGCGSVVPASSPGGANGATTMYVAPTGLPIAGETFTLVATRHDDPTEFATAEIVVTPCSIGEAMCGDFTFFVQGFDANGKPANTAGHFTATGLVNGNTMITNGGVIDLNDSDGIDAAALITSGSYTFDTDSNGNLLPNVNSLTGTITLNIASSLTPAKSHAQRTYAFTVARFGLVDGKASLIEFEPAQTGTPPATNPASGFQGSGFLWQVGPQGPYGFASPCAANPANTPPSKCNYAFGFQGSGVSGQVSVAGAVNINVDANNNCNVTSNISPAGNPTVVRNQPSVALAPQQGGLFGSCGMLSTVSVNGAAVAETDDVNGRGTAQICLLCSAGTPPTDTFAYYVVPRAGVLFVDITKAGTTLSGLAHPSVNPAGPINTLGCGTLLELGQVANCLAYTSGGSQKNGTGSNGSDVTLTLARLTCPTPNDGGASCQEKVTNGTLTGKLGVTLDQVTGGLCDAPVPTGAICGPTRNTNGTYSIETTTGIGFLCPDSSVNGGNGCSGATDPKAITYADGFLLANDETAALGSLTTQVFPCTTPCVSPQPFGNANPGPFVAASIPSFQPSVPNVSGSFDLSAPASSTCAGTPPPVDNFDSDALYASGTGFLVSPVAAVTGCYIFDNPKSPLLTGRGTGTSTNPGPGNFIFYAGALNALPVLETDNAIPGGQALITLTTQNPDFEITSASSATFGLGQAPTCNPGPGNQPLNCFTVTATGLPTPTLCLEPFGTAPAATPPATCSGAQTLANLMPMVPWPAGVTLVDQGNGTATLSGNPAAGTAGTYLFLLTAYYKEGSNPGSGCASSANPNGTDICVSQNYALTVQ